LFFWTLKTNTPFAFPAMREFDSRKNKKNKDMSPNKMKGKKILSLKVIGL
jgi:hypothetical protein